MDMEQQVLGNTQKSKGTDKERCMHEILWWKETPMTQDRYQEVALELDYHRQEKV